MTAAVVGAPVYGTLFDSLANRANYLRGTTFLRSWTFALQPYKAHEGGRIDRTFYLPLHTGPLKSDLETALFVGDVAAGAAVTVSVRLAPAPGVDGFSAPGSGALIDRGYVAAVAPFRALSGALERNVWRTGFLPRVNRGDAPVDAQPQIGAPTEGMRLLASKPSTKLEVTVTAVDVALIAIAIWERWQSEPNVP